MFQEHHPDADTAPVIPPTTYSASNPHQEKVRHVLYGSLEGIEFTIKDLYAKRYADPGTWSDPLPTGKPNQWMAILTRVFRLER